MKKILVVSDAAVTPTGFGRVAASILDRLHGTGEWEIHQLGINYKDQFHDKPYRIYVPNARNPNDWLGTQRIKELYAHIQPDVVWLFQDYWNIAQYIQNQPNMKGLVTYYPVDAGNMKASWAVYLGTSVEVCTYTNYGVEVTQNAMHNVIDNVKKSVIAAGNDTIKNIKAGTSEHGSILIPAARIKDLTTTGINIVPHGIDSNNHEMDKEYARRSFEIDKDLFIVGSINRNQPRKRLDLLLQAFTEFAKDKPNARLLFHDPLPAPSGWDLAQLVTEHFKVKDKIIFSNELLSEEQMNYLYNIQDVSVTTGPEGWGLNPFFSAAARVPVIVPDFGATKEIWEGAGMLTGLSGTKLETEWVNTEQCVINPEALRLQLEELYASKATREAVGDACFQVTQKPEYSWENVTRQFEEIFDRAAAKQYNEEREPIGI